MNCFGSLTLNCLVTTKRSHILKQTCSFPLQVYLSMCGLLVKNRHKMVNSLKHISNETIISKDFENRSSLKNVQENLAQAYGISQMKMIPILKTKEETISYLQRLGF